MQLPPSDRGRRCSRGGGDRGRHGGGSSTSSVTRRCRTAEDGALGADADRRAIHVGPCGRADDTALSLVDRARTSSRIRSRYVSSVMGSVDNPPDGRQAREPSKRFPLSVIILTYNEVENIPSCLSSVEWADDVILVDSGSTDGTVDLARKVRSDVRTFMHPFGDFGAQRNWALDETTPKHDWVLFLDADERCDPGCAAAIRQAVMSPGHHVGFYLTYRNFFLDRWIKHCTLYPTWQLRLLKLGAVRFEKEGHGQREVTEGPLGYIREPYDH